VLEVEFEAEVEAEVEVEVEFVYNFGRERLPRNFELGRRFEEDKGVFGSERVEFAGSILLGFGFVLEMDTSASVSGLAVAAFASAFETSTVAARDAAAAATVEQPVVDKVQKLDIEIEKGVVIAIANT
jgi:hypothetical protein